MSPNFLVLKKSFTDLYPQLTFESLRWFERIDFLKLLFFHFSNLMTRIQSATAYPLICTSNSLQLPHSDKKTWYKQVNSDALCRLVFSGNRRLHTASERLSYQSAVVLWRARLIFKGHTKSTFRVRGSVRDFIVWPVVLQQNNSSWHLLFFHPTTVSQKFSLMVLLFI